MMDGAPSRCPVCDSVLAAGSERCMACGKVFGESNRCPSCHAIAAVREVARGRYVCAACSAPRERLPGTPLDSDFAAELARRSGRDRVLSILFWVLAVPLSASGAGLLAVALGLLEGGWQIALNVMGAPLLGFGLLSGWLGRKLGRRSREQRVQASDARMVLVAERAAAGATAADVARALALRTGDVDAALTRLAKQGRVGIDVDEKGVVRYRVADPERDALLVEEQSFEAELRSKS